MTTIAPYAFSNAQNKEQNDLVPQSSADLCDVRQLIIIKTLDVVLLHQSINVLLDIGNLGWKPSLDLVDDLFHELDVLELLAALHDANDDSLWLVSSVRLDDSGTGHT